MIVRIVKMTFDLEKVDDFLKIFNESKKLIRNSTGCTHLELLRETNTSNVFFTYSHWNSETDLENYRNSQLFKTVWAATKVLFVDAPCAWSLDQIH